MSKFQIKRYDDEREEYYIDGKEVGSSNHDEHGWAGMEAARNMFEVCAKAAGEVVTEMDDEPSDDPKQALWDAVAEFIDKQDIACAETVYQTDRVIENAYGLIESLCDIVGYKNSDD